MWSWLPLNLFVGKKQKLAYVFAIVGNVTKERVAEHLTAIELLKKSGAQIGIVSLQTPNSATGLSKGLKQLNVTVRSVLSFRGPCKDSPQFRFEATYDILQIWNLTEYDKVLYLDNDLAVRSNPDNVFKSWAGQSTTELRTPTGCSDPNPSALSTGYNTGVWGVTPSRKYFVRLKEWLQNGSYACGIGFQTWANAYGRHNKFSVLPVSWNLKADTLVTKCMARQRIVPHIVHWSGGRKPHNLTTVDKHEQPALLAYQQAHKRWMRVLTSSPTN
tara:strand:- start:162 stop:980 length:819 start_codon:yes stop_codon:yes gene_type:complete